jgi:hypothetical protein
MPSFRSNGLRLTGVEGFQLIIYGYNTIQSIRNVAYRVLD